MTIYLPDGLGGTGAALALASPLYLLGTTVIYLDSVSGVDDGYPAGASRSRPVATLAQAVSNSEAGGIIVLLSTHDESIISTVTQSKAGLTIIGEGVDSNGIPSASLRFTDAVTSRGLYVTADETMFQNIRFKAPAAGLTKPELEIAGKNCIVDSCYFELDENTQTSKITLVPASCPNLRFKSCTFVSTEATTTIAAAPRETMKVNAVAGDMTLYLDDCVFDGGLTGFKDSDNNPYGTDFTASTGTVRIQALGLSLLRGAYFVANDEGLAWGYINVATSTGGARVIFTDSAGGGAAV